jgi:hypothetical protein
MLAYRAKRDSEHRSVLDSYTILGFISSGNALDALGPAWSEDWHLLTGARCIRRYLWSSLHGSAEDSRTWFGSQFQSTG